MKYLITESKLDQLIVNYLNLLFDVNNIHHTNPTEYDYETGEDYDDDTRVEFYFGDYEDGDNNIFKWYSPEYFNEGTPVRDRAPLVFLEDKYAETLNLSFSDMWHEPFKRWFTENFNLPINDVEFDSFNNN